MLFLGTEKYPEENVFCERQLCIKSVYLTQILGELNPSDTGTKGIPSDKIKNFTNDADVFNGDLEELKSFIKQSHK